MPIRRLASWCLIQRDFGAIELTHGNRHVVTSTRSAVLRRLAIQHRAGERVFEAAEDGYKSDVTDRFIREGWIKAPPPRRRKN